MNGLTPRDRELVALGAAMGSNCVPCVEYHIPEARNTGLADAEIHAAILHADKIRQVPARKTLQAAMNLLTSVTGNAQGTGAAAGNGCGATAEVAAADASKTSRPSDPMMSKMMAICGNHGLPDATSGVARDTQETIPGTSAVSGCC